MSTLLSKLDAQTQSFDPRVDGSTPDKLTGQDIAAALGTMQGDDSPSLLARAKYSLDPRSLRLLQSRVKGSVLVLAANGRWSGTNEQHMRLAMQCVQDAVMPALCLTCEGKSSLMVGSLKHECHTCKGTGLGYRTDSGMASLFDITVKEWRDTWEKRYCNVMNILSDWETQFKRALFIKLNEDVDKIF